MAQPPVYSENPPPYQVNSEQKQKPSEQQPVPQLNYPQSYPQSIQQRYSTAPMPQGQYPAPPGPVVIYQQPVATGPRIYEKYKSRTSIVLGWIQIVLSFFSIVFNSIGIWIQVKGYDYNFAFYIAAGIWVPVLFVFLSGTFAICAGKKKTKCLVITNLVLSIISSVALLTLLGVAAGAVGEDSNGFNLYDNCVYGYSQGYERRSDCEERISDHRISLAMGAMLLIISLVLMVCTIWSSALGCAVACCGSNSNRTITASNIQYLNNPAGGAPIVVYTNQLPGGMPHTTVAPPGSVQQGMVPTHTPHQPLQQPGMTGPAAQPTTPQVVHPIQQTTQPPSADSLYQPLTRPSGYTALYNDTVPTQQSENSTEGGNVYDYVDPSAQ